jgi:flavodoxin I
MKFALSLMLPAAVSGFAFTNTGRTFSTSLNAGSMVYFSTSTGNTEVVAGYVSAAVGCEAEDISDASASQVEAFDSLIIGAPTWHTDADTQRSGTAWDDFLYDDLPDMNLEGKKVAVFGVGDQAVCIES